MTIVFRIPRQIFSNASRNHLRHFVLGLILTSFATLSACQPEKPKMVGGLTGVVFNYDQTHYTFVKVNNKEIARGGLPDVPIGRYSGGGGGMCCSSISLGATEANVTLVEPDMKETTIVAPVEKWWPDAANYLVVHILPGKKAVVQIRNNLPHARADLLEKRLEELGLPKQISSKGYWLDGPEIRTDGKE